MHSPLHYTNLRLSFNFSLFSFAGISLGTWYAIGATAICASGFVASFLYYNRKWVTGSLVLMALTLLLVLTVLVIRLA